MLSRVEHEKGFITYCQGHKTILMGLQTHKLKELLCNKDYLSHAARKPVFGVSDQARHKPGCTTTDGQRLEISALGSRGIVLSV